MQPEQDFDQLRRTVFESAKRLLEAHQRGQPAVTTADVAAHTNLDLPLVTKAVQALAVEHLDVEPHEDWQYAEILGVDRDLD